jgi:hypothetical protein
MPAPEELARLLEPEGPQHDTTQPQGSRGRGRGSSCAVAPASSGAAQQDSSLPVDGRVQASLQGDASLSQHLSPLLDLAAFKKSEKELEVGPHGRLAATSASSTCLQGWPRNECSLQRDFCSP